MKPLPPLDRHLALLRELRWFIGLTIAARLIASVTMPGILAESLLIGAVIYSITLYLVLLTFLWFGWTGGES